MNEQLFEHIFDGVKQAIERSRFASTLLIIACVLCATAYWNGKENSWGRARMNRYLVMSELDSLYHMVRDQDVTLLRFRQFVLAKRRERPSDSTSADTTKSLKVFREEIRRLHGQGGISDSLFERLAVPWISTDFVEYLLELDSIAPVQAEGMRQAVVDLPNAAGELAYAREGFLQARRAYFSSTLFIDLPFFGLAFDLNDLALLSGLGFTLFLLALVYNLVREHHNIESLLDWVNCLPQGTDKDRCKRLRIYQAAVNFNVLTIPPQLFGCSKCHDAGHDQIRRGMRSVFLMLSKVIYLIPVTLHIMVRHNDQLTKAHGFALQPERLHGFETLSTFFLVTISILTVLSILAAIRIEMLWVTFAGKVRPGPTENQAPCVEPLDDQQPTAPVQA